MKKTLLLFTMLLVIGGISYAINTLYEGRKIVKNGGSSTINVYNECRVVTNNRTDNDIFVPTNSSSEWLAFRNNTPTNIDLGTCGCVNNNDCSSGYVCTGYVATGCYYKNPCDFVASTGRLSDTDIMIDGCSTTFHGYYHLVGLSVSGKYGAYSSIPLNGSYGVGHHFGRIDVTYCKTNWDKFCQLVLTGGYAVLNSLVNESAQTDTQLTTQYCGSNNSAKSGLWGNSAVKSITCQRYSSTCNYSTQATCQTYKYCGWRTTGSIGLCVPYNCDPNVRVDTTSCTVYCGGGTKTQQNQCGETRTVSCNTQTCQQQIVKYFIMTKKICGVTSIGSSCGNGFIVKDSKLTSESCGGSSSYSKVLCEKINKVLVADGDTRYFSDTSSMTYIGDQGLPYGWNYGKQLCTLGGCYSSINHEYYVDVNGTEYPWLVMFVGGNPVRYDCTVNYQTCVNNGL